MYDGIDAVIYPSAYYVKYDFIIAPGANANQIQLQYEGVNNLRIENGNLVYDISFTQQIETKPVAWQIIEGEKFISLVIIKSQTISFHLFFPKAIILNTHLLLIRN